MGWIMRSQLQKLPIINVSDIDIDTFALDSLNRRCIKFALTHPYRCSVIFSSLAEIDAYCSEEIRSYQWMRHGNGDGFLACLFNVGTYAHNYDSTKGPYLIFKSTYKTEGEIYGNKIYFPQELVVRIGPSTWQVFLFRASTVKGLTEVERRIFSFYYCSMTPLKKVAELLKLSKSEVSQIIGRIESKT